MTRTAPLLPMALLGIASLILALEPLHWLLRSWRDPAYQSSGHWFAALLGIGMLASWLSGKGQGAPRAEGLALIFLLAAALRLGGQVQAVNILSALALAVDVYALARLARLEARPLALSPVWLAVFFLFALPLAPLLERVAGFPLQVISARISCALLTPVFTDLVCEGVRLRVAAVDVLVDLPCSGATGLLLLGALWTGLTALLRPAWPMALLGGGLALALALVGNALRISLLAGGLASGIDTMEPLRHAAIGLLTQGLGAAALLALYRPRPALRRKAARVWTVPPRALTPLALLAACAALAIVLAPAAPFDRSGRIARIDLPRHLLGHLRAPETLTDLERHYFEAFGGVAQKASYGPLGLNVVQTAAPLRHLHAPATCLLGMGYEVTFLGTRFAPVPSSVYRATGPDGRVWHVAVSYVSADGHSTASVGEAVWSWLTGRSGQWASVQRITPHDLPPEARAAFEQAALAALDL